MFELGFRQGSLSEPGRALALRDAIWINAPRDPHYVDKNNYLLAGDLPFLELPVTTDPENELARGVPYALQIEAGSVEGLHREVIMHNLERFEAEQVPFCTLLFYGNTRTDYYQDGDKHTQTLEGILDYLEELQSQYTMHPVTAASAHDHYRLMVRNGTELE